MQFEYHLPQEWVDYLATQPESGMGYQVVDIQFSEDNESCLKRIFWWIKKRKILKDIPVINCQVFWHDDDSLNLDDIVDIEVNKDFSPFGKWGPGSLEK